MHKNIGIITLILVTSTVTGCAKFRELTRRDYALLKDPFLDRSAVAQVDEAPAAPLPGVSGVVQVADLSASGSANQRVTPASDTHAASAASNAAADFQGVRVNGMGNAIAQENAASFADYAGKATEAVATAVTPSPNSTPNMEDFTQFVKGQAVASGMAETAKELDEDLNEYFVKQNEEWNKQAQDIDEQASPLIDPMRAAQQATMDAHPEMPSLPKLGFGSPSPKTTNSEPEIATPLIRQTATPQGHWVVPTATTPEVSVSAPAPVAKTQQPAASHFAPDPFSDFSAQSAGPPPVPSNAQMPSAAANRNANPFGEDFNAAPKPQRTSQNAGQEQWNAFNNGRLSEVTKSKAAAQESPFENPFNSSVASPFDEAPARQTAPTQQTQNSGFNFDSGWRPSN